MKIKSLIAASLAVVVSTAAFGQSQSFKLGKWTEIQNSILKELNRSYVDSLPVDRIERAGINAMLGSLDPYTVYIPEEENEDLMMMINKSYGGIGAIIYNRTRTATSSSTSLTRIPRRRNTASAAAMRSWRSTGRAPTDSPARNALTG